MAQKFSLYGDLTVWQNLLFFSGVYGLQGGNQKKAVTAMVEVFDLHPFLGRSAAELPLGFKQRLALACAVIHRPDVLFLDEPTSGVDPITRREFWNHINGVVEKGVTVLVTTHFMDEAEYCDRIGLIYRGRKIAEGSPDHLKAEARTPEHPDPTLEDAFIALIEHIAIPGERPVMKPSPPNFHAGRARRVKALIIKESLQIVRDPSSIMIAFVLPLILLFLFGYGVSLDARQVGLGVVLEDTAPAARPPGRRLSGHPLFRYPDRP